MIAQVTILFTHVQSQLTMGCWIARAIIWLIMFNFNRPIYTVRDAGSGEYAHYLYCGYLNTTLIYVSYRGLKDKLRRFTYLARVLLRQGEKRMSLFA